MRAGKDLLGFDFFPFPVAEIEGVERGPFFGGDPRGNEAQAGVGDGAGDAIEQAGIVGGLDVEQRVGARGLLVDRDMGGHFGGIVNGEARLGRLLGEGGVEIELLHAHRLVEDFLEGGMVARIGHRLEPFRGDEEGLDGDVVGAGEDVGLEDGEAARGEGTGDPGEEIVAVPGDDGDLGVTLVGEVTPADDGLQRGVVVGDLVLEEAVDEADVLADEVLRHAFEVSGRQVLEVGDDFSRVELAVEVLHQPLLDLEARLFGHGHELGDATEGAGGAPVKLPEEQVFPVGVGVARTGAERVGKGKEH